MLNKYIISNIYKLIINFLKMKDKQLYSFIEKALEETRNLNASQNTTSFGSKYVALQIQRRKLNPFDPNRKMNNLMAKFKGLETYVDINQLIPSRVESYKIKKVKSEERFIENNKENPHQNDLMKLIKTKMSKINTQQHDQETVRLEKFITALENSSELSGEFLKNNSPHSESITLKSIQRNTSNHHNYYKVEQQKCSHCSPRIQTLQKQMVNFGENNSLQSNKQYSDLLHKASTYLHIILQNQHRAKWNANKTTSSSILNNNHSVLKTQTNQKFRKKLLLQSRQRTTNSSNHFNSQTRNNDKKKTKAQFNFRKRTLKEGILNKLSSFIQQIQNQEYINKKLNRKYLKGLNNFQRHLTTAFDQFKEQPLTNDKDIEEVTKVAQSFK